MSDELRVVHGDPSAEELAVVIALVTASTGGDADDVQPLRGRWNDPRHAMGAPLRPGPGAWRAAVRTV